MGFDCRAITVIGLRITKHDLQVTRTHTYTHVNCSCKNNNSQEYAYCPTCGRKNNFGTYTESETNLIDEFEKSDGWNSYGTLQINENTYTVIQPINKEYEKWLYVTIYKGKRDGPRNYNANVTEKCEFSLEKLVDLKNAMKEDLSEIGLWNESNFGIYTLIYFSY